MHLSLKLEDYIPELELNDEDITALAGIIGHPGFAAYQKVWKHVVSVFALRAVNTDQADPDTVLARHNAARVAAQLYQIVTDRVNGEIGDFISSRPSDIPIEAAPNLDLGDIYIEDYTDGEEPNE